MMIKIDNVMKQEDGLALEKALSGTYMDLKVLVCPAGGSFDVWVQTLQPGVTEEDLGGMVLMVMAQALRSKN